MSGKFSLICAGRIVEGFNVVVIPCFEIILALSIIDSVVISCRYVGSVY